MQQSSATATTRQQDSRKLNGDMRRSVIAVPAVPSIVGDYEHRNGFAALKLDAPFADTRKKQNFFKQGKALAYPVCKRCGVFSTLISLLKRVFDLLFRRIPLLPYIHYLARCTCVEVN